MGLPAEDGRRLGRCPVCLSISGLHSFSPVRVIMHFGHAGGEGKKEDLYNSYVTLFSDYCTCTTARVYYNWIHNKWSSFCLLSCSEVSFMLSCSLLRSVCSSSMCSAKMFYLYFQGIFFPCSLRDKWQKMLQKLHQSD